MTLNFDTHTYSSLDCLLYFVCMAYNYLYDKALYDRRQTSFSLFWLLLN